jgi:hypothetical protein
MKYIVFDHTEIIIFRALVSHDKMAFRFPDKKPTSAGFVGKDGGKLVCYGRSYTLDLGSIPFDSDLLNVGIKEILQGAS